MQFVLLTTVCVVWCGVGDGGDGDGDGGVVEGGAEVVWRGISRWWLIDLSE